MEGIFFERGYILNYSLNPTKLFRSISLMLDSKRQLTILMLHISPQIPIAEVTP